MNKAVRVLLSQAINSHKLCNYSQHKCFDQVFGVLKRQGKAYVLTEERQEIPTLQSSKAAIIIILESPHIAEFDPITKQPLGPCQGKTGENIAMYLSEILKSNHVGLTLSHKKYDIVLLNAIQYQCSLGEDTKLYRDAMFLYYWEQLDFRKDFVERLIRARTTYSESIIVNCCTKGEHINLLTNHSGSLGYNLNEDKAYFDELGVNVPLISTCEEPNYSLKHCVNRVIHDTLPKTEEFYLLSHPSSWYRDGNQPQLQKFFRGIKRNVK